MRPACFLIAATTMVAIGKQRMRFGGADRDRTGDPLLAKQVLSQLSYSPKLAASFQPLATSFRPRATSCRFRLLALAGS